jgi:hypothetical protein
VLVKVCEDWAGELGPVVPLYWADRRVKSSETSTLALSASSCERRSDFTHLDPSEPKVTIP